MQTNLQIKCRKAIKINDNGQYFDFIRGTLNYVTYVMFKIIFQKIQLVAYKLDLYIITSFVIFG